MNDGQLYGWKEIAKHLGCCVRTAKNYHYNGKMPLIRCSQMGIRAFKGELDLWIKKYAGYARVKRDIRNAPKPVKRLIKMRQNRCTNIA